MTTRSQHNPRTGLEEPLARIEVFESTANLIKARAGAKRGCTIADAAQELIDPESDTFESAMRTLVDRIEKCAGAPEQTQAVILASDIQMAFGKKADSFAMDRVRKAVKEDAG